MFSKSPKNSVQIENISIPNKFFSVNLSRLSINFITVALHYYNS